MRQIKLDRKTWLRGGVNIQVPSPGTTLEDAIAFDKWMYDESMLLRGDGLMCCIGQACSQLGVPLNTLRNAATVADIRKASLSFRPTEDEFLVPEEFIGDLAEGYLSKAYEINDDDSTTDVEKESALIELFAQMGIQAEFIK